MLKKARVGIGLLAVFGILLTNESMADSTSGPGPNFDAPWPMHPIDDRFRGANGLSPGDVNRDGFIDYVTNYEFDQRLVVSIHPGQAGKVRQMWPTVVAWKPTPLASGHGVNPEHSTLGDFDGDGNLDVAAAQGFSKMPFWEGSEPGIRIVWGPAPTNALDENAWQDAGRIPATIDRGHLIYVVPYDVNGDGAVDIISGGRVHAGNHRKGGVIWVEAPSNPAERRELSQWQVHDIDPEQFSAHGLILNDVDEDGDMDIVLANADFDTPESEEKILWYENPGPGSAAQKYPWPGHLIYQGREFDGKPQVAASDLDGDKHDDLITQTAQDVYYFKKISVNPVSWQRIVIPKDPVAQWPARPINAKDINGDGKLELVGMLMHQHGTLPANKAAVFWMEYDGPEPRADNWKTHVIKWGSGKTMFLPIFAEKWDQMQFADIDQDGDLDLVANCEEWWVQDIEFKFFWQKGIRVQSVSVVWFENRLGEKPYIGREHEGLAALEAEHYTEQLDGSWIIRGRYPGFTGDGYVQDYNRLRPGDRGADETQGLAYAFELTGGSYRVWLRVLAPREWGSLGRGQSNSAWLGVDGNFTPDSKLKVGSFDEWTWISLPGTFNLSPGIHQLILRVCEGGFAVDSIILTKFTSHPPPDNSNHLHSPHGQAQTR